MWGTLDTPSQYHPCAGFIPTHVGNTQHPALNRRMGSVHPHTCGEHLVFEFLKFVIGGSSPHMWGTPYFVNGTTLWSRFIPTHVGNTEALSAIPNTQPVHPHTCGEHSSFSTAPHHITGSSPHMWGTPDGRSKEHHGCRFIPTHVGNTIRTRWPRRWCTVHPHTCGEHSSAAAWTCAVYGSSPHMWGTLYLSLFWLMLKRFIPTHVGNTPSHQHPVSLRPVHPHTCGEHRNLMRAGTCSSGSSPHMWGTLWLSRGGSAGARFIPTHVGNTGDNHEAPPSSAVHPHTCGEHQS